MAKLLHKGHASSRVKLPEIDEPVVFDARGVSEEIDDDIALIVAADLAGYALIVAEPTKSDPKTDAKPKPAKDTSATNTPGSAGTGTPAVPAVPSNEPPAA